jgi:hypothetical protein
MKVILRDLIRLARGRRIIGLTLGLLATASAVGAAVISHDTVRTMPENILWYHAAFRPYLKVESGCVPFPAVDAAGNVNGGLQNSGAKNGGCSKSTGQVYVRDAIHKGRCAIMYSWYFPKDQNVDGGGNSGHRHDWESIVVWLKDCYSENQSNIISVAYSSHGSYLKTTQPVLSGLNPQVAYKQDPWPLNHSLAGSNSRGGTQPAITWLRMSAAARNALNTHSYGKATVPFNDANFTRNLDKAY